MMFYCGWNTILEAMYSKPLPEGCAIPIPSGDARMHETYDRFAVSLEIRIWKKQPNLYDI